MKLPIALLIFSTLFFVNPTKGQKLLTIQKASKKAPANIKIDGDATEWGDAFEAYHPVNRVYYTIANDDKYLYVMMRMDDNGSSIFKALGGGISFRVQPTSIGNATRKLKSITFPAQENRNETITDFGFDAQKFRKKQTEPNLKSLDSLSKVANKKMRESYKEIEVNGMDEEGIDRISLYNTEGIKIAPKFNSNMEYLLEIAIPLQFLGLDVNSNEKFKYGIAILGTTEKRKGNQSTLMISDVSKLPPDVAYSMYTTDFWSEYTLIK